MDRRGARGPRPKNHPPKDLFALGSKSSTSGGSSSRSTSSHSNVGVIASGESGQSSSGLDKGAVGVDRKRETSSSLINKKTSGSKPPFHAAGGFNRHGPPKPTKSDSTEGWESVAEVVESEDLLAFLEFAEEREDLDKIEAYLCGAAKVLRNQRIKPDNILCLTLAYLAKVKPTLYSSSPLIIEAFCSLLRKSDHGVSFKTKNNPSVAVLAVNILLSVFQEERCWPEVFIRVFIDDSLGERVWVDHEDCKGFVENIICSFKTKTPPKSTYPDIGGLSSKPDCPSPPIQSSSIDSGDADSELSLECRENFDVSVYNRYTHMSTEIEEMVTEAVQFQLNIRHQNVDALARNFIRFLSAVTGILEVRKLIAPKLETWLQNLKHQRLAIELLNSLCLNCNTHSQIDQKVIGSIVHIRIKIKPLTNQYLACIKELLSSHPDNIASVIKETTFNELSPMRNLSNMAILSVVFQYAPEHSAAILADIFLELLRNTEDFLRALRALLREIVRSLRHDMQFHSFCLGLLKEQKDPAFKDSFEFKERMFHSIVDLVVLSMFVSISPQIRDGANLMYRGDNRDVEMIRRYQEMVSLIQQDALYWMHRIVPKAFSPSKEEYMKSLHKILMMDQPEVYYHKDNWPTEGDRPLYFRLSSEVPLKPESLHRLIVIGTMKDQYMKPQDILELVDKLVKRQTAFNVSQIEKMLLVEDVKTFDLIFNLCSYLPPENSLLPAGYRPPKTAIANLYWKAWSIMVLITTHNPTVFGVVAWESYPTLRVIMEMCITNTFIFPPPTMSIGERAEEMNNQEMMSFSRERQQILEFESHLAQKTITEQNSLLLSQLITMDPLGPARKPPSVVLDQLKTLNSTHKIGNLLCRCRKPDFLVDIIQRQGAPQSMPWLVQLVESSEDAFSILPVQCLCEFLLSESVATAEGTIVTQHEQLLQHLRCLLLSPKPGEDSSVEILDYFLRRLGSQQPAARNQAVRGLQMVVGPLTESMELDVDKHEPYKWLLKHLPALPGFPLIKNGACQALRAACMLETKPAAVSAYIRFLAIHTCEDSLQEMSLLVQDMAQLIVERSTMISAILPSSNQTGPQKFPHAVATLNSLFIIFINYMHGARVPPQELFNTPINQDHVRIQWASGEQAIMHILVVHAMVILLIYGPCSSNEYFEQLLNIWFPKHQEMPQAFLVDTAQEALLLPDWLKLKMIRSVVPELVDAALKDLEPSQLVLFIQSFGIPVESMTKLLCALDLAVRANEDAVAAAVLDKSHKNYMAQLVEVQHKRGARGGHAFAATLGERDDFDSPSEARSPCEPMVTAVKLTGIRPAELNVNEIQSFVLQCFTSSVLHIEHKNQVKSTMRTLQQHLSKEINDESSSKKYTSELLKSFTAILQSHHAAVFSKGVHLHHTLSVPLFRLLFQMKEKGSCAKLYAVCTQLTSALLQIYPNSQSPLTPILAAFSDVSHPVMEVKHQSERVTSEVVVSSADISPQKILEKIEKCSLSEMEKLLRNLVECAIIDKKVNVVVNVIVHKLIKELTESTSTLPGSHLALFMDWLQILDPELSFVPFSQSKLLLFGSFSENRLLSTSSETQICKKGVEKGCSQAYLLAAFTHQANWPTLEKTIKELLKTPSSDLNPTAILDFIWAVLHVPKLWQGRERRTPRHVQIEMPLNLNSSELITLTEYILSECSYHLINGEPTGIIQKRIELLFYCVPGDSYGMKNIISHLNSSIAIKSEFPESNAPSYLLYQLYLHRPCTIKNISKNGLCSITKIQESTSSEGQSAADVYLHTLLTMLSSPLPGKDFNRRMLEIEAAVRKMASSHPLLVIRHLSLLAASLQGITKLHWSVFVGKNYGDLFSMVMGVLELLRPYIFKPKYAGPFTKIMDSFVELFTEHGRMRELGGLILRTCQLLLGWISTKLESASSYVSKYSQLFSLLSMTHPEMIPLRSLAAIAVSKGSDHPKRDKTSDIHLPTACEEVVTVAYWHQKQINELLAHIESCNNDEEQSDILRKVQDLSDSSSGAALPSFFYFLSEGILSKDSENRRRSWNLLTSLLKKSPKMSTQTCQSVLSAVKSPEISVASAAVKHLPKVILMLHEFAVDILSGAFDVCLSTEPEFTNNLSEAMLLLTIHTGA